MTALRHTMILASAGSGKTYALTNRFIALLAAGAAPERIVALTFTRKAAGEFFDDILRKLARAAADPKAAQTLASELGRPQLGPADWLRLLRQTVDTMHRLRLGTLDSFFARIARAFPLELGLAGEFEILQEHAARVERRRVLRRMFARTGGGLDAAQTEFIEAFKRATFGTEEKKLGARLDAFLDEHEETFLAAPEAALWGDAARIWRGGASWFAEEIKLAEAARDLRAALGVIPEAQRPRWEQFFLALAEWTPGAPLPAPVEYILKNAFKVWHELCGGGAEMIVERRKVVLSADACRALHRVITHLVAAELRRRLEMTRGIFAVLRSYEANYHDAVRRAGRLTFADVQRLLAPVALASGASRVASASDEWQNNEGAQAELPLDIVGHPPPALATQPDAAERRLLLDYRLDAEIDHWLLDEFQDTSFGQWSILQNLIDEVVQDTEGGRSFFCVGDVKQAIYAWREGDPRLFREIFNHYNAAAPGAIEEQYLVASWRSGPALIEMVNAVFGRGEVLADLFPGEASSIWNREWRDHRTAVPERTGQAALLIAADEAERWAMTRQLLDEIRPCERGLTCAVLVKKNDTAAGLADELRRAGIAAMAESDLHVAIDNPLGAALLALMQAAAHPGDGLAQEHVHMTPLRGVLSAQGLGTREALTRKVLAQVHAEGFERTVEFWIAALEPQLAPDDRFSRVRAREFAAAAGLFDATGSRNVDEFIAFMERHTARPPERPDIVRVMTVHKAKGLGFDVVILPDLQGNRIDERRDGLAVQKAADRAIDWVLDLPPKLFCAQDEVLAAHVRGAEADAGYENLCLLYVAMTRAKRAMYVITEPVGDSKSRNFPKVLAETLGHEIADVRIGASSFPGVWHRGDPEWHRSLRPASLAEADVAVLEPLEPEHASPAVRRMARRPSADRGGRVSAAVLFSAGGSGPRTLGIELHALLAEVEWVGPAGAAHSGGREIGAKSVDVIVAEWKARARPGPGAATIVAAEACLRAPALAAVWSQPKGGGMPEVWRERPFEIVLDGAWISGAFDRVVIERDADGRALRALVFDFKSDRIGGPDDIAAAVARYAGQLNLYRRVAAVLTGLPAKAVRAELVFSQICRAVEVPPTNA
jgi:ATP-dependent helicase/nuclease subunit A